jgi:hypothetical protein
MAVRSKSSDALVQYPAIPHFWSYCTDKSEVERGRTGRQLQTNPYRFVVFGSQCWEFGGVVLVYEL